MNTKYQGKSVKFKSEVKLKSVFINILKKIKLN
jgi:hypothetical protein